MDNIVGNGSSWILDSENKKENNVIIEEKVVDLKKVKELKTEILKNTNQNNKLLKNLYKLTPNKKLYDAIILNDLLKNSLN